MGLTFFFILTLNFVWMHNCTNFLILIPAAEGRSRLGFVSRLKLAESSLWNEMHKWMNNRERQMLVSVWRRTHRRNPTRKIRQQCEMTMVVVMPSCRNKNMIICASQCGVIAGIMHSYCAPEMKWQWDAKCISHHLVGANVWIG